MLKMAITLGLLMLLCLKNGCGQIPNHPEPSESSTAQILHIFPDSPNTQLYPTSHYMEKTNPSNKHYTLYSDYGSGNMLYVYQLGNYADYGSRNVLIRDDLSTTFQYLEPFGYCSQPLIPSSSVDQTEVQFPARWTWLSDTVYSGSTKFHKKDVDLWTYVFNDTASTTSSVHILGVSNRNPNVLKFYFMYTLNGAGFGLSVYDKFINGDPSESVFNIPNICKASGLERPARTNNSQTPMRPKLAESFSAKMTYIRSTFYINEEPLRSAKLYRDYHTKKQLQVNQLGLTTSTSAGNYYRLLQQENNTLKQYSFFEPFSSCHITNASPDMIFSLDKPMFQWVQNAEYSGVEQFRNRKVNMWTYTDNSTSTFYSLGVSRRNPSKPIFLYEMDTYYTYRRSVMVFETYKPGPPQPHVFTVPKTCPMK